MTVPGLDFIAVDFETANGKRESACAVGVAVVRDGKVTAAESWLIKPPSSAAWFNQRNTAIHGITKHDCDARGVPWPETVQRLEQLCAGLPIVAHNASFDRSVWESANRSTGVDTPVPSFHCTLQLSRGHLDLVDHKLPTVVRHLGLDDFPHHRAEADALAAAQVTVELAQHTGSSTVEELWQRAPRRTGAGSSAARPASTQRIPESVFRTRVDRPTSGASHADPTVPVPASLQDEVVVITGELTIGEREDVEERLREAGATVVKSATQKLTCLVIGAGADVRHPPLTGATGKEKKVIEHIQAGRRIAVIGEPELKELLEQAEAGAFTEEADAPPIVLEEAPEESASVPVLDEPSDQPVTEPADHQRAEPAPPPARAAWERPMPPPAPPAWERPAPPAWGRPASPAPASSSEPWQRPSAPAPRQPASYPYPPASVPPAPGRPSRPGSRWKFHAVMWSVMLFLTVGMFVVALIMSLAGVPESVWAAATGISWLLAPVVFLVWLVMTIVHAVRSRRRRAAAYWS